MPSLLALQLADASFPTGGFAHSAGLESAVQHGLLDAGTLGGFVSDAMTSAARFALPFAYAAFDAPGELSAIDARLDVRLVQHVARRASRTQGRALVDSAARIFDVPAVTELRAKLREPHHAPAFGAIARHLGLARVEHGLLFMHLALRGLLSAAVRLNVIGPIAAQRLQHHALPRMESLAALAPSIDDAAQTFPVAEILQGTHDRLYSRLFQS